MDCKLTHQSSLEKSQSLFFCKILVISQWWFDTEPFHSTDMLRRFDPGPSTEEICCADWAIWNGYEAKSQSWDRWWLTLLVNSVCCRKTIRFVTSLESQVLNPYSIVLECILRKKQINQRKNGQNVEQGRAGRPQGSWMDIHTITLLGLYSR